VRGQVTEQIADSLGMPDLAEASPATDGAVDPARSVD